MQKIWQVEFPPDALCPQCDGPLAAAAGGQRCATCAIEVAADACVVRRMQRRPHVPSSFAGMLLIMWASSGAAYLVSGKPPDMGWLAHLGLQAGCLLLLGPLILFVFARLWYSAVMLGPEGIQWFRSGRRVRIRRWSEVGRLRRSCWREGWFHTICWFSSNWWPVEVHVGQEHEPAVEAFRRVQRFWLMAHPGAQPAGGLA